MAKDIIIQQDGVAQSLSGIDKLRTNVVGGGSTTWVPEDETRQASLTVYNNGTYEASTQGYHSFSHVVVDVSVAEDNRVIGRDTDGNDYEFTVDGDGNIVQTKVPSSIKVTTPPSKMVYNPGDEIDYSGTVVTLYDGEGNVYTDASHPNGTVSYESGELSFSPSSIPIDDEGIPKVTVDHEKGAGYVKISYMAINQGGERVAHEYDYNPNGKKVYLQYSESDLEGGDSGVAWSAKSYNPNVYAYEYGGAAGFFRLVPGTLSIVVGSEVVVAQYDPSEGQFDDPRTEPSMPSAQNSVAATVTWERPDGSWALTDTFNLIVYSSGITGSGGGEF